MNRIAGQGIQSNWVHNGMSRYADVILFVADGNKSDTSRFAAAVSIRYGLFSATSC